MGLIHKFRSSIRRGTGEAYLLLKEYPQFNFSDEVIYACLKNCSYDGQSENSRADYLYKLISLSSQKNKIKKAILKGLETEIEDTWSLTQLFDIVKKFAQNGDNEAKECIYSRFFNKIIEGSAWCGSSEILELDGFKGLTFIARTIGKALKSNPDDWQDDSIIKEFQDDNPNINAMLELKKLAKKDNDIKAYIENIKRTEENYIKHKRERDKNKTNTDGNIINEIINSRHVFSIKRYQKKELSNSEIKLIAEHFLKEKDIELKIKFLDIFSKYKFPVDYKPILEIAKAKPIKGSRLPEYAKYALANLTGNDIRYYALEKLKKTTEPWLYTNMLKCNYNNGDDIILNNIALKFHSEHIIENLACSYIDIYTSNPTPKCKSSLETLYSKMNCGIHRNSIVELLIKNNVLSEKIEAEIRYDSYFETRQLLKDKDNKKNTTE